MGTHCDRGGVRVRVVAPEVAPLTFERIARWCDAAERGLARALGEYADAIREGVNAGVMELWRVDGDSWLVTQVMQAERKLVAWCYQGRDVHRVTAALCSAVKCNGLEVLEFATRRKGLPRMLRSFGFELTAIDPDGIQEFQAVIE